MSSPATKYISQVVGGARFAPAGMILPCRLWTDRASSAPGAGSRACTTWRQKAGAWCRPKDGGLRGPAALDHRRRGSPDQMRPRQIPVERRALGPAEQPRQPAVQRRAGLASVSRLCSATACGLRPNATPTVEPAAFWRRRLRLASTFCISETGIQTIAHVGWFQRPSSVNANPREHA